MATAAGGKKVSNSTLGLRFMQNALRAKQQLESEAEQGMVKDESQWEVDSNLRESWIHQAGGPSGTSVTCESSYLPFLFPSPLRESNLEDRAEPSTSVLPKARGRRKFNKQGQEVPLEEPAKPQILPEDGSEEPSAVEAFPGKRSLSSSNLGVSSLRVGVSEARRRRDSPVPLNVSKMLAAETPATVGLDLKASHSVKSKGRSSVDAPNQEVDSDVKSVLDRQPGFFGNSDQLRAVHKSDLGSTGFMRPAGVDSPLAKPRIKSEKRSRDAEDEGSTTKCEPMEGSKARKKKKKEAGNKGDASRSNQQSA